MNKRQIVALHDFCTANMELVGRSTLCGCFHCKEVFAADTISSSCPEPRFDDRTAICPFCDVDSILPDATVMLSAELLQIMHQEWFEFKKRSAAKKAKSQRRAVLRDQVRRMLTREEWDVSTNWYGRHQVKW